MAAHNVILEGLEALQLGLSSGRPCISEEGDHQVLGLREQAEEYWLIDPLDGTKEFINQNGEFTVNVALIRHGQPIMGAVTAPTLGVTWFGIATDDDAMAVRYHGDEGFIPLHWQSLSNRSNHEILPGTPLRLGVSRSHISDEDEKLFSSLAKGWAALGGGELVQVPMGSSLKLCKVADWQLDCYARNGATSHWDTAAGHAVLLGAGGQLLTLPQCLPLTYPSLGIINPGFLAVANPSIPWQEMLR